MKLININAFEPLVLNMHSLVFWHYKKYRTNKNCVVLGSTKLEYEISIPTIAVNSLKAAVKLTSKLEHVNIEHDDWWVERDVTAVETWLSCLGLHQCQDGGTWLAGTTTKMSPVPASHAGCWMASSTSLQEKGVSNNTKANNLTVHFYQSLKSKGQPILFIIYKMSPCRTNIL